MEEKISIRPINEDDTDKIIEWRNKPSISQYFIYRAPFTRETHLNWLHNRVQKGEVFQFIIMLGDKPIGSAYLRDIDNKNKKGEYGIFIGEDNNCGKGFGTIATNLVIDYGFKELKLNRIFLRVFPYNIRAIKSYEKVGFKHEGLFREDVIIDGKSYDMKFMSILRRDWDTKKQ